MDLRTQTEDQMTDDFTDDIRRQVQDRIDQEMTQLPPLGIRTPPRRSRVSLSGSASSPMNSATERFTRRFSTIGSFSAKIAKNGIEWAGHHWQRDILNHSLMAVEEVVAQYLLESSRVGQEIAELVSSGEDAKSQKIVRVKELHEALVKRASQLRGDRRRTSCLKFAHTIDGTPSP